MERIGRKKTEDTRDRILDAAEDVFNDRGFSGTTLNEIAEAAGVTRGAIYWHFKNKDDLFEAMCSRVRKPMTDIIEETANIGTEDPLGILSRSHESLMYEVINNPHYQKILNILFHKCEFTKDTDQVVIQQKEWQVRSRNLIQRTLANAQRKKQLPSDLDIDLADKLMGFVFKGLVSDWLFLPNSFDLVETARKMHAAIFDLMKNSPYLKKEGGGFIPFCERTGLTTVSR